MADYYKSIYSGAQIDTSLGRIINGELDTAVDGANAAAGRAESAATAIRSAINNLPVGAVPVIDDLTTGGRTVALSAEQGIVLRNAAYSAQSTASDAVMAMSEHEARTDNPHAVTAAQIGAIPTAEKGAPNGVAPLDSGGKLPAGNLLLPGKNLLDNAWFASPYLENQRGKSSYGVSGNYSIDRFIMGGAGSVAVGSNGLTFTRTGEYVLIAERVELERWNGLVGKKVTASLMIGGSVYGVSFTVAASGYNAASPVSGWNIGIETLTAAGYGYVQFVYVGTGAVTVQAVKLELGSISTLHLDTPPSPAEQELNRQACRRYYRLWTDTNARTESLKSVGLMRLASPTLATQVISGTTYYSASADL